MDASATFTGMTDQAVADLVGVHRTTITKIRAGKRPSLKLAFDILDKTGVRTGRLVGKTDREISTMRKAAEALGEL